MTQRQCLSLIGYSFTLILALITAGCSGGDNGGTNLNTDPGDGGNGGTISATLTVEAIPGTITVTTLGTVTMKDNRTKNIGKASDFQTVSYDWSFTHIPTGSTAVLNNPNIRLPSFTADKLGTYILQFVASASGVNSERAIVTVEVVASLPIKTGPGTPETILWNHDDHNNSQCVECHKDKASFGTNDPTQPSKPGDHVATSKVCQACHSVVTFTKAVFVDHREVFGNCSSCHDGVTAIGKSAQHVETNAECNDCHTTDSFFILNALGKYDHTNVYKGCDVCHNGVVAIGKDSGTSAKAVDAHISTADCFQCHVTNSTDGFKTAKNHLDLTQGCLRCHGDNAAPELRATGKSLDHPVIASDANGDIYDCNICHNTSRFTLPMPRGFNHRVVDYSIQTCDSCHNPDVAPSAKDNPLTPIHNEPTPDCGMCHSATLSIGSNQPRSFLPPFPNGLDHSSAAVTTVTCASCHDGNTATGLPPQVGSPLQDSHLPMVTGVDCGACHTPGTFTSGVYDHLTGDFNNCLSCHNDVISIGISINHIPVSTAQQCSDCHNNTNSFVGATFHNGNAVTDCASCHDGVLALGKSANIHIPTAIGTCESCHAIQDPLKFFPSLFISTEHTGITQDCFTCHSGRFKLESGLAIRGKHTKHIPALNVCEDCHVNADFTNTTFAHTTNAGTPITGGCEGCHNGRFVSPKGKTLGKPINIPGQVPVHLPTQQDCDACHVIGSSFTPATFNHTGISGNCVSCHDGNYTNIRTNAFGLLLQLPKVHINTALDCGVCHNTRTFIGATVNHLDPAVVAVSCGSASCHDGSSTLALGKNTATNHVVTADDCKVCHVTGTFIPAVFDHSTVTTTTRCDSCHNGVNATGIVDALIPHVPNPIPIDPNDITNVPPKPFDCVACHNTVKFAGAKFDHQGITNNCSTCHDGTTATGKHTTHVPTTGDCSVCHVITGFIPATFDHNNIVGKCIACHDGTVSTGKPAPPAHVATNSDCGVCHSTKGFVPATFDHSIATVPVGTRCDSCHGVGNTIGLSPNHFPVPSGMDCGACHTTTTFVGGTWVHDSSTANNCKTCHSLAGGATPQPPAPGHFATTVQCDQCHTTKAWAPADTFTHNGVANFPIDHGTRIACVRCHKQNDAIITYGWFSIVPADKDKVFCASCHSRQFESEGDHIGGRTGTIEQNRGCGAQGCHSFNGRGF